MTVCRAAGSEYASRGLFHRCAGLGDGESPARTHAGLRGGKSLHEPTQFYPAVPANHGGKFTRWLLNQRIIVAQRYLEKTDQPVDDIAERVGFPSTTSLRRHFHNLLNTSPSRYRREFRGR